MTEPTEFTRMVDVEGGKLRLRSKALPGDISRIEKAFEDHASRFKPGGEGSITMQLNHMHNEFTSYVDYIRDESPDHKLAKGGPHAHRTS